MTDALTGMKAMKDEKREDINDVKAREQQQSLLAKKQQEMAKQREYNPTLKEEKEVEELMKKKVRNLGGRVFAAFTSFRDMEIICFKCWVCNTQVTFINSEMKENLVQ